MRNRPIKLSVRVNQTENQYLTLQAHSSGLSKEAFIRKLIMGETIKAKPPRELAELLRLLKLERSVTHTTVSISILRLF